LLLPPRLAGSEIRLVAALIVVDALEKCAIVWFGPRSDVSSLELGRKTFGFPDGVLLGGAGANESDHGLLDELGSGHRLSAVPNGLIGS
jgi:hypothetical protein